MSPPELLHMGLVWRLQRGDLCEPFGQPLYAVFRDALVPGGDAVEDGVEGSDPVVADETFPEARVDPSWVGLDD